MNIFNKINTINLNGTSSKDLQDFVAAINSNFQKVASLPFLKGDQGTNIEINEELLVNNKSITDFGKSVYKAYYNKDYQAGNDPDNILAKKTLRIILDNSTGDKYLLIPQLLGNQYYVTGDYITRNGEKSWLLERHNIIPKLKYDKDQDISTWEIDGVNTNIIANGVKGADGKNARCWIANGTINDNKCVVINNFLAPYRNNTELNLDTTLYYYDLDNKDQEQSIKPVEGDLVIVYTGNSNISKQPDIVFGILRIDKTTDISTTGYYILFNENNYPTIQNLIQITQLQRLLDHTGKYSPIDNVRGLYTYPTLLKTIDMNPTMLWAVNDDKGDLNITRLGVLASYVESNEVEQKLEDTPLLTANRSELHLEYPNTYLRDTTFVSDIDPDNRYLIKDSSVLDIKTNNNKAYLLTTRNRNLIASFNNISNSNSQTNNINISQDTVSINPLNNSDILTACLIPSFTVKYEQDSANDLRITNSKLVNLGGEYSFSLPYLGYLKNKDTESTNKEIYNATQFTRLDNSTDPLKIILHEVELNHNGDTTDNTGFGWRSFYDVDLLSSPCSYNKNNEACVYVGSSECDIINTLVDNTSIKYKLKISVIQYRVAYNDNNLYKYKSDDKGSSAYLEEANGKQRRTVTEVIYYLIDSSNSTDFNCLRYRLFFNQTQTNDEAINTIYVEPIKKVTDDKTKQIIDADAITYTGNDIVTYQTIVTLNAAGKQTITDQNEIKEKWETSWDNIDTGEYNGRIITNNKTNNKTYNEYLICDNNQHKNKYKINILKRLYELGYFPSYNLYNTIQTDIKNDETIQAINRGLTIEHTKEKDIDKYKFLDSSTYLMNSLYKIPFEDKVLPFDFSTNQHFNFSSDLNELKNYLKLLLFRYFVYKDNNNQYQLFDVVGTTAFCDYRYINARKYKPLGEIGKYAYDIMSRYQNNVTNTATLEEIYEEQTQLLDPLIELLKEKAKLEYELICIVATDTHTNASKMQSVQPQYDNFTWVSGQFNNIANTLSGPGCGVFLPTAPTTSASQFIYNIPITISINLPTIEDFYNISFKTDGTSNKLTNKGFLNITVGDYTLHKVCKDIAINNKKVLTEETPVSFMFATNKVNATTNAATIQDATINTGGFSALTNNISKL